MDALKCFGILLVIEGHVWDIGMGIETYDSVSGMMLYSFNMPIFFFVSGFLAYKEAMGVKEFCKRLWQKFLFLVVPAVVFKIFMDLYQGLNPIHVIRDGFGGYWFTITLFECFLIYYLVALLLKKSGAQMICMALLALVGIGLLSIYGEFGPKMLDMNRLTKYFQYFVFGLFAMRYRECYERTMKNEWFKAGAIIAFFSLLFTINQVSWPTPVFHLLRDIVLRYLGTFIVISFFVCKAAMFDTDTRWNGIIRLIGQKSLAIYLLQYFFIPCFMAWPEWIAGLDSFTVHVISIVYTVVIVTVCYMFITLLSNSIFIKKYIMNLNE